uniref:7TM_GPCR_Srx domain-containing protein n=1 Tax=Bursaphelenchus xylophilus TaxID=6326 RepID=A0A1I7SFT4_BURXY
MRGCSKTGRVQERGRFSSAIVGFLFFSIWVKSSSPQKDRAISTSLKTLSFPSLTRKFQAFPGWFSDFFEHGYAIYIVIASVHVAMYMSCCLPFVVFSVPDKEQMKAELLLQLPQLKEEEPNISYICVPNTTLTRSVALLGFLTMLTFFTLGTGLYINLFVIIQLERRKATAIANTQRLQLMLFKAVGVQLWVGYALLLFPTAAIFLTFFCQWRNGTTIAMFAVTLMTTHGALDYATMLWFITPYRRIVAGWLRVGRAKQLSNPSVFGVTTITIVQSQYRHSFSTRATFRNLTR